MFGIRRRKLTKKYNAFAKSLDGLEGMLSGSVSEVIQYIEESGFCTMDVKMPIFGSNKNITNELHELIDYFSDIEFKEPNVIVFDNDFTIWVIGYFVTKPNLNSELFLEGEWLAVPEFPLRFIVKDREFKNREERHLTTDKIYRTIWNDANGRCEICGQRTSDENSGHFFILSSNEQIIIGNDTPFRHEDKSFVCFKCKEYLDIKGTVLYTPEIELFKNKAMSYKHPSHPRFVSPDVRKKVWIRDKGRCVKCGSRSELQYDHIIPISKGGSNSLDNIQLLCKFCNQQKLDRIE